MKLNIDFAKQFVNLDNKDLQDRINQIHKNIHSENKPSDYLGWLEYPNKISKELLDDINNTGKKVRSHSEVLVVIGIGGSYLGSKAGIEFLEKPFNKGNMEVVFAGQNVSGRYLDDLIKYLEDKDFSINVISKSGTTTEPAIAFRILRKILIDKYGDEHTKRIIATTDESKGSLYDLSIKQGYKMFVIPDDIGGRFSVLTPVGLVPFAVMGYDIYSMIDGAKEVYNQSKSSNIYENDAYLYAAMRYLLYKSGKKIEMLVSFDPNTAFFSEWWKQLFAESEGKDGKGLFVGSALFSTDLHSIGQYIQDGERHIFETVIAINSIKEDVIIQHDKNNLDNLNYLEGKSLKYINDKAMLGAMMAHVDGGVPNLLIEVDDISEKTFGRLVYFFMLACTMSAYLLEVNPFDQPGVEKYKENMFALLGKKGYENKL